MKYNLENTHLENPLRIGYKHGIYLKTNDEKIPPEKKVANVISVQVSGDPGDYQFSVEIQSPDTGCGQYADWWEVIDTEGNLIYRRILQHSHVNEQPFVRSGGPVAIEEDTIVWVRAHMHPGGYGGIVYKGSVRSGFKEGQPEPEFGVELERMPPLPDSCADG